MSLPAEIFGSYSADRHEGFDEYMASEGVPWLLRKVGDFLNFFFHLRLEKALYRGQNNPSVHLGTEWHSEFTLHLHIEVVRRISNLPAVVEMFVKACKCKVAVQIKLI